MASPLLAFEPGEFCRWVSWPSTTVSSTTAPADDADATPGDFDASSFIPAWPAFKEPIHAFFAMEDVQRWDHASFRMERTICRAPQNKGRVDQMLDACTSVYVAVKTMPNDWVCECQELFAQRHPFACERPWVDICCTAFLTSIRFPYVCPLLGVYRSSNSTSVVTEFASHGDLFGWAAACGEAPGQARERLVRPLAGQIADAVRRLHDLSIVHGDISAENVLLVREAGAGGLRVQIIDFGMATGDRWPRGGGQGGGQGRAPYRAPEVHSGEAYDGFLADAFAVGVVLCSVLMREFPWTSTRPGACRAFTHFQAHGFDAFAARRKCFKQKLTMAECTSELSRPVLAGLLSVSPSDRLTLGECVWQDGDDRPSLWHLPWMQPVS
mmetsp:Transcript_81847/g.254021  ORF Transcript_81847/g.254021 Transcript_81847/m.254021 type:complete len:383 (-) Transcript_81847:45-1193(-)